MKDYKVRQKINNALKPERVKKPAAQFDDDTQNIIQIASDYFNREETPVVYPAKSFSVAIVYALLIKKLYDVPFFESLNDEDLLCQNDLYFKTYRSEKAIYDQIIAALRTPEGSILLNFQLSNLKTTLDCFNDEFDANLDPGYEPIEVDL